MFFFHTVYIFFHSSGISGLIKEVYYPRLKNINPPDLVGPPAEAGSSGSKIQCLVD